MRFSKFMESNEGNASLPYVLKGICKGVRSHATPWDADMEITDDMIINDILSCDEDEDYPGETHIYEWHGWVVADIYWNQDSRMTLLALRLDKSATSEVPVPPSRYSKLKVH